MKNVISNGGSKMITLHPDMKWAENVFLELTKEELDIIDDVVMGSKYPDDKFMDIQANIMHKVLKSYKNTYGYDKYGYVAVD